MGNKRLGVGVAVTGGCLYAVGGSDGTSPLSSVERSARLVIITITGADPVTDVSGLTLSPVSGMKWPHYSVKESIWG